MTVPPLRVRALNQRPVNPDGAYVLYWMTAARRPRYNYALEHAAAQARVLKRPLVVFEALRAGYPWASERLHRFVIDGMHANRAAFAGSEASYLPYVEPAPGAGRGLLEALAASACVVVADDDPGFFFPRMLAAAAAKVTTALVAVDTGGLLPLRAADRVFRRAFDFRRFLQHHVLEHLAHPPQADPLAGLALPRLAALPSSIPARWPSQLDVDLAALPIDHRVQPVDIVGGHVAATRRWQAFLRDGLGAYGARRNHPDQDGASRLSPYLHFGHISPHELFADIREAEQWHPGRVAARVRGQREGWWNMSPGAESFLDELLTWRELGRNMSASHEDHTAFESLPGWAQETLQMHQDDPRPHIYALEDFEQARTHDEIWNAAQRELVAEGRMHNYLRMLWGKKILEWTPRPQDALQVMIELNNKYALDGRDPSSYAGIFWVLGRYDRAWGPQRPIYGKVRYMSSASTRRKLRLTNYLQRHGPQLSLA